MLNISKNAIFTNGIFFLIIYSRYEIDFIKYDIIKRKIRLFKGKER